jgi:hypothetical protein
MIFTGSRYPEVNEAVEKLVNKLNRTDRFPDYYDILKVVKVVGKQVKLPQCEQMAIGK